MNELEHDYWTCDQQHFACALERDIYAAINAALGENLSDLRHLNVVKGVLDRVQRTADASILRAESTRLLG